MGIEWSDESAHKKEMQRWDRAKRDGGMNRDGFERFPQMLYRVQFNPQSGRHEVAIARDVISLDKTVVILSAEQFNATCQLVVHDTREYDRARDEGWRDTPGDALQHHDSIQNAIAQAAAERAHADRNMSPAAKLEIAEAEEATDQHVAEVKEKRRAAMAKARAAKVAKAAPTYVQDGNQ